MNQINRDIPPERHVSLSEEDRKNLFGQAASFQEDKYLMGRAALRASYWLGGTGLFAGLCGMVCAATLFPLKTREVEYYTVNQTTGAVGPSVSAKDAPTLFAAQVIEAALQTYVELRENYLYETDAISFHRVTIMSTVDEQARYKALHDAAGSPARKLGSTGYIQISDIQVYQLGIGKFKTYQYLVRYNRKVMLENQPVPDRGQPCVVEVDFQFHPEYAMSTADRRLNVTGFQAVGYRVRLDASPARITQ